MIDIQAGDVVVCVDDSPCECGCGRQLVQGRAFQVSAVWVYPRQTSAHVRLVGEMEHFRPGSDLPSGWDSGRFRKVQKCDEDFTEFMASFKPSKVKA